MKSIFNPQRLSKAIDEYYVKPENQPSAEEGWTAPTLNDLYPEIGAIQKVKLKVDSTFYRSGKAVIALVAMPTTGIGGFWSIASFGWFDMGVKEAAVGVIVSIATLIASGVYIAVVEDPEVKLTNLNANASPKAISDSLVQWIQARYDITLDSDQRRHLERLGTFSHKGVFYSLNWDTVDGKEQRFLIESSKGQQEHLLYLIQMEEKAALAATEAAKPKELPKKEAPLALPVAQKQRALSELEYLEV